MTAAAVIDIEREALAAALAWGLDACGDDFAIHAFSSLKRDRVYMQCAKRFGEPMTALVEARIAGLKPGFYTRLGAAIRHASAGLSTREARKRRLLLVITDGKPNDLDHYEGRHGIEDSHMAVREARSAAMRCSASPSTEMASHGFRACSDRAALHSFPIPRSSPRSCPRSTASWLAAEDVSS